MDRERQRIREADEGQVPWRRFGPYLSERAWGTVREDYSPNGDAWSYFPFEHAASRAFRWSEDGLGGVCDDQQLVCLALALWNGEDPILKERAYGLTGEQGNHGEDVKDYWWYMDATPTSSLLEWRYHYPQRRFPYEELRSVNATRSRLQPEYELVDTGIFSENRFFVVTVTWAKAGPEDLCWHIEVANPGPQAATAELLPTIWFRNRWSWDPAVPRPVLRLESAPSPNGPGPSPTTSPLRVLADLAELGGFELLGAGDPEALFCDNETNLSKLYGIPGPPWPKDGIADHILGGTATVNPGLVGTKAALRYRLEVPPGGVESIALRFRRRDGSEAGTWGPDLGVTSVVSQRKKEADDFYAALLPAHLGEDQRLIGRQAGAGMLWSKQFFHYNIERWIAGDPGQPSPPPQRRDGRNSTWVHLDNRDVISMPDPWEYPWYAAWDLAFHCVPLAHLDAAFAKRQLILLCREWYMHPNGQLPAYEWNFSDVNPPVQAWAALRVFEIDRRARLAEDPTACGDYAFLERVFQKLLLNFTWWVNRKDASGNNVFQGGFLGLDNIGLFDRSKPLPVAGALEQSDGTAWMAMFSLNMLEMALLLASHDDVYEDLATKFFEHFTYIASAMESQGLWNDADGFFYDVVHLADGSRLPVRVCSVVGMVALFAVTTLDSEVLERLADFDRRMKWFCDNKPQYAQHVSHMSRPGTADRRLLSIVDGKKLRRVLEHCLGEEELLSAHGLRSLSRRHGKKPFTMSLPGAQASIDYEPAESTNYLFGGNSNWRGPVWFPLNYLFIEAMRRFDRYFGPGYTLECPTGSGNYCDLGQVATAISQRLVSIFSADAAGSRPVFGNCELFQQDPLWKDQVWFHEYFHAETGAGLGASHQTGWTGLVLDLIIESQPGEPAAAKITRRSPAG